MHMIQDVKGIKGYTEKSQPTCILSSWAQAHGAGYGRGGVLHSLQLWETAWQTQSETGWD